MTRTRIQQKNRAAILDAGLKEFAARGFDGATLDDIARVAGMSKPNLLYYFASKDEIYSTLLEGLLDTWLDPLRAIDPDGDPIEELVAYAARKLALSRDLPWESRLFAGEILRGAPVIGASFPKLRDLVEDKAAIIEGWSRSGRIAPVDARQFIISVWALTQHYADFGVQVRAVLDSVDAFDGADAHLDTLFRRVLLPG